MRFFYHSFTLLTSIPNAMYLYTCFWVEDLLRIVNYLFSLEIVMFMSGLGYMSTR